MKLIYYVENIKSTNFILGTNTKSTNLRIHELGVTYGAGNAYPSRAPEFIPGF
jgi:hypothetical protein